MSKPTIFISHITEEKEIANSIKEFLEKRFLKTINVFASSHEESLKLGDDWMGTIKKSMNDCKLIVVLCSPLSITRPWINFEAGAGWIRNIPVIPLCHSGLTPGKLPVPINSFQGGILNNETDISKVFKRIADILEIDVPDSTDKEFFSAIESFETDIKNTALSKDTVFIHNLLFRQIELLKYSIFASTLDYKELESVDLRGNGLKNHKFTFNDTFNLFNASLLMIFSQKKVFDVYHQTVHELSENIKFVLTYSRIEIAPKLRELLNVFLFSTIKVDDWYDGVSMQDKQTNNGLREMAIKMIKEEPLPATRKFSNLINHFIDYHESLEYFQSWVIEYETEINNLLENKNKG
ncbi:toll/interleukin-1 receptor domain-containing protein [Polaribacter sp. M15]